MDDVTIEEVRRVNEFWQNKEYEESLKSIRRVDYDRLQMLIEQRDFINAEIKEITGV